MAEAGNIERISVRADGSQADGASTSPFLSADGTKLAFLSTASNLVGGDTNGTVDVFIKDLVTGTLTRLSTGGLPLNAGGVDFSDNLGSMAFASLSETGRSQIYVLNTATGAITQASAPVAGVTLGESNVAPTISPDGTKVIFRSNLPDDGNASSLYIKDLVGGTLELFAGRESSFSNEAGELSFSRDGTKVVFETQESLSPGDPGTVGIIDIYVKDLTTGLFTVVSASADGVFGNGLSSGAVISPDGTKVAFVSYANNLVPGDTQDPTDVSVGSAAVYIKDLSTGTVTRAPFPVDDPLLRENAADLGFSPDGRQLTFRSAVRTSPDGSAFNSEFQIFLADLTTGDLKIVSADAGGDTAGSGASNSFFLPGGRIGFVSDSPDLVPDDTNGTADIFIKTLLLAPGSGADNYVAGYDKPLVIAAPNGVLANDTDANGDALTAILASGPTQGTVSLRPDGSFTYTPNGRFIGVDSFTYRPSDGEQSGPETTVSITVNGNIIRVSTRADGAEAPFGAGATANTPDFSQDGTKIAFTAPVGGLAVQGSNGFTAVYVKDLVTGAITAVSDDGTGQSFNGNNASDQVFSPDGSKIAFTSGFFGSGPAGQNQIVVKDLATGSFTVASSTSTGALGDSFALSPVFASDGIRVAFTSLASNLVAGDTNGTSDIFVKNLSTGAVARVSTGSDGSQINSSHALPVFSPDGTKIAFVVVNLGLTYLKDLTTGSITEIPGEAVSFSADGRTIAFSSNSRVLVSGDTNGDSDVFVKDLVTGTVTRVSTNAAGEQAETVGNFLTNLFPQISPDGTQVVFVSRADNLDPDNAGGTDQVYVKTLATGALRLVSADSFETIGAHSDIRFGSDSTRPTFSPDGKSVAFFSIANNLVPGDTNASPAPLSVGGDIFIKDLTKFPFGSGPSLVPPPPTLLVADVDAGAASGIVVTLTGLTQAGNTVTFLDGTTVLGTTVADAGGAFSFATPDLSIDPHSLLAFVTNASGAESEDSPTRVVESGTAEEIVARLPTLSANADLAAIFLTDGAALPFDSIAAAEAARTGNAEALSKIVGDYAFAVESSGADGQTVEFYDEVGQLFRRETTAVDGDVTTDSFDSAGVLLRRTVVDEETGLRNERDFVVIGKPYASQEAVYDAADRLVSMERFYADGVRALSEIVAPDGSKTVSTWTPAGALTQTEFGIDGRFETQTRLDETGVKLSLEVRFADGSKETTMFDPETGEVARSTLYAADRSRTEASFGIEGKPYDEQASTYDVAGRLTGMERHYADGTLAFEEERGADGSTMSAHYDTLGRLTASSNSEADGSRTNGAYTYEGASTTPLSSFENVYGAGNVRLSSNQGRADGIHVQTAYAAGAELVSNPGVTDTLIGFAGGGDIFIFDAGFGKDTIRGFEAGVSGADVIVFDTALVADLDALEGRMTRAGNDTLIAFDADTTLTIRGVLPGSFDASDFRFVDDIMAI